MIEISERITRVTTSTDTPTGARVTVGFCRSVPLSPGQAVRLRYVAGNGRLQDWVEIAHPTHIVARRGHLVAFHYRLSHWIANRGSEFTISLPCEPSTAMVPERAGGAPAVDHSLV